MKYAVMIMKNWNWSLHTGNKNNLYGNKSVFFLSSWQHKKKNDLDREKRE